MLPAVRKTDDETLIIASGFSCHEQIVQQTIEKPLHIAEVLRMAMTDGTPRPREPLKASSPKSTTPQNEHDVDHQHQVEPGGGVLAGAGAVLAGLAGALLLTRKKKHDEEDH